jgi:MYXO-CTERM domain-containing protein
MKTSNYTTLRVQNEAPSMNAAWQIESSLVVSPFQIESPVLVGPAVADYTPVVASDAGTGVAGQTADQVRQVDLANLFPAGGASVRITRMRADLAHAALANDLVLQASTDQSTLSNVYQVTQSVNAPACPPVSQTCPCSGGSSGALDDGGTSANRVSPGTSRGCAASTGDPGNGAVGFIGVGFAGMALLRARRRRSYWVEKG